MSYLLHVANASGWIDLTVACRLCTMIVSVC
jgi:hypothetical protein